MDHDTQGRSSKDKIDSVNQSLSEVTIYKRAVKQIASPEVNQQVECFVNQARLNLEMGRKSSSSDEMDTSEEDLQQRFNENPFVGKVKENKQNKEITPQQHADNLVREAKKAKARMYEVPGKDYIDANLNVSQIDEDYQMIDSHVDESLKKRIQAFKYIDFVKLVSHNWVLHDDEGGQRLEIVNRNGLSYLSPVADLENVSISSYSKWEQAFRVYSNILTSRFPGKATKLLKYNHTIHTASATFIWDNVYAYDKEFCHHISRHPYQSWSVILQQAWTMLLKDKHRSDNSYFQKGGFNNKNRKEPCRRFNKGKCTAGSSCKYDHRCLVKKCGKFGHGVHICRIRLAEERNNGNSSDVVVIKEELPK